MQTRTKKTLTTAALGLAFAAAAAGTASAAEHALPLPAADPASVTGALGSLPLAQATQLVPGAADTAHGTKQALSNGTSVLPGNPGKLVPSGNHVSGNSIGPVSGLLGGLPTGSVIGS